MHPSRRSFLRSVAGATGIAAGVITTAGTASAATPDFGGYLDGAKGGTVADERGSSSVTVEVGGGASGLAFLPTGLWIDPGTEVTFEWSSSNHNVVVDSQPSGASWGGSPGGSGELYNDGYSFSATFDTEGIYTYYCQPHRSVGMLGAIAVGDSVPTVTPTPAGGGGIDLPTDAFGTTFLGALFGVAGVAAAGVLAKEFADVRRREAIEPARADLTEEQYRALQRGESIEVATGDGSTITVNPPEE